MEAPEAGAPLGAVKLEAATAEGSEKKKKKKVWGQRAAVCTGFM